jgi:IS30 family transposase
MPGHSRTKTERVIALEEVARLDRRGYNTYQIATKLGVSHQQVSYDLKAIRKQYAEATISTRAEYVAEKVQQLRDIEREAWDAWERSKEDKHRDTTETVTTEQSESSDSQENPDAGLGAEAGGNRIKRIIMSEGRLPDSSYLQTILACHKEEAALRELYPPQKHKYSGDEDEPPIKFAATIKVISVYVRYFGLVERGSETTETGLPHCDGAEQSLDPASTNGKASRLPDNS